jgi:PAS domain S-box-containing protein
MVIKTASKRHSSEESFLALDQLHIIGLVTFCVLAALLVVWLLIQRSRHGRSKAALRTSEERYLSALAGSTDGLWDWDLLSDTVFYSDRFREILGYSSDAFPGTIDSFRNHLHPDDADAIWTAIERHLQERVPYKIEYRLRTKSGEYLWFLARGQAIWNTEGKAIRMSGWIQDITERKQAELNLQVALSEINWNTTMRTLSVKVMGSIMCSIRWSKLPPAIQPFSFWVRPEPARSWWPGPFMV